MSYVLSKELSWRVTQAQNEVRRSGQLDLFPKQLSTEHLGLLERRIAIKQDIAMWQAKLDHLEEELKECS